jgi:maltodextrin utilization protein YvdJ
VHETGVTTEETIVDPIAVEEPSQEKWQGITHRGSMTSELAKTNSESLNLAVVRDEFNVDTFDENLDNEQHVEENDELASSESDEENMQSSVDSSRCTSRPRWRRQ